MKPMIKPTAGYQVSISFADCVSVKLLTSAHHAAHFHCILSDAFNYALKEYLYIYRVLTGHGHLEAWIQQGQA